MRFQDRGTFRSPADGTGVNSDVTAGAGIITVFAFRAPQTTRYSCLGGSTGLRPTSWCISWANIDGYSSIVNSSQSYRELFDIRVPVASVLMLV